MVRFPISSPAKMKMKIQRGAVYQLGLNLHLHLRRFLTDVLDAIENHEARIIRRRNRSRCHTIPEILGLGDAVIGAVAEDDQREHYGLGDLETLRSFASQWK